MSQQTWLQSFKKKQLENLQRFRTMANSVMQFYQSAQNLNILGPIQAPQEPITVYQSYFRRNPLPKPSVEAVFIGAIQTGNEVRPVARLTMVGTGAVDAQPNLFFNIPDRFATLPDVHAELMNEIVNIPNPLDNPPEQPAANVQLLQDNNVVLEDEPVNPPQNPEFIE